MYKSKAMPKWTLKLAGILISFIMLITFVNCFACVKSSAEVNVNFISNSTFESGTKGWGTYIASGGNASLTVSDGKLALNVNSLGKLNYGVQLYYETVPMYKNGIYHVSYEISSTADRKIETMIQQNGGTYQSYSWKELNLTAETQKVDYTFTMSYETDLMTKFVFNCGNYGTELEPHTIYLDNVVIELIDDSNVNYPSAEIDETPIIINQVGYQPDSSKIAIFRDIQGETEYSVINADTNKTVFSGDLYGETKNNSADETNWYGDFSSVTEEGNYYIHSDILGDSYTFRIASDVYNNILDDSVRMLYLQRCGMKVIDSNVGHNACHTSLATIYGTNEKIDVAGGWHDAGDYGRYIVPASKAVADLLNAYNLNPDLYSDNIGIPESGNGIPDILDEVRYELEWMLKMQSSGGGVYHKVSCEVFPGYVNPEQETDELIVTPVSTTATADFCASMAMAYEFYLNVDSNFAEACLNAAKKAWEFLEKNPNFIFNNPENIVTGEYGDTSDRDERYWAAAQMYRATREDKYLTAFENIINLYRCTGMDWNLVGDYGNIAYLTMKDCDTSSEIYDKIKTSIINQAGLMKKNINNNSYGISVSKLNWGSNMTIANAGIILSLASELSGDVSYMEAAATHLNYLLGSNPNGVCFVTGYGTVSPEHPHHRPSMVSKKAAVGMLVGGVNSNLEDSAAKAYLSNDPSAKCYIDNWESYSTNEITIYWNSPFTYLMTCIMSSNSGNNIVGDIDSSGYVDSNDVKLLNNYLIRKGSLSENQGKLADLNNDNKLDVFDLMILKRKIIE